MNSWSADALIPTADAIYATADGFLLSPTPPTFDLEMVEIAQGNVQLYWPNWGFDSYGLQINNVQQQTVTTFNQVISGLLADTPYKFQVFGIINSLPVTASNPVTYQYGSKEQTTITYMKRIRPFPSVGFN